MSEKTQAGLNAALVSAAKGTLVVGDAITPLADDSWFMIDAIAVSGLLKRAIMLGFHRISQGIINAGAATFMASTAVLK